MDDRTRHLVIVPDFVPQFAVWARAQGFEVVENVDPDTPLRLFAYGAWWSFIDVPGSRFTEVPPPLEALISAFWLDTNGGRDDGIYEVRQHPAATAGAPKKRSAEAKPRDRILVRRDHERERLEARCADFARRHYAIRDLHRFCKRATNADAVRHQHRQAKCSECGELLWRGQGYYVPDPEADPAAVMCVNCQLQLGLSDAGHPRDERALSFEHDDGLETYLHTYVEA